MDGYKVIAPLTYRGKLGCESVICTHEVLSFDPLVMAPSCYGWHCSYCDEPCSYQGHGCDASTALIEAAESAYGEKVR